MLPFAGSHLVLSLLAFNLDIELGQLLVPAVAWPAIAWIVTRVPKADKLLVPLVALVFGHAAWHWLAERFEALARADWSELLGWVRPLGRRGR